MDQYRLLFLELQKQNVVLAEILQRSEKLGVRSWAVGAGFLQQSTWNVLHGRPMCENIKDIDWVYFDDTDLSESAEAAVIARVSVALGLLPLPLDIKNQARVHVWYEEKFGYAIEPYVSLEDAIGSWPTTSTAVAMTSQEDQIEVIAPFGLEDLMTMTVRPNKRQITADIYRAKLARWRQHWPLCSVVEW